MASTLGMDTPNLDSYIADKALEGPYTMIAAQEKSIRENPVERTTELLQKVFAK
jgi:hypothetical protein